MNRRKFSITVSALMGWVACTSWSSAFAVDREAVTVAVDDDSYAIWSILIPILRPNAKSYLVPSKTTWTDMVSGVMASPASPLSPIERAKLGFPIEMKVPAEFLDRFQSAAKAFKTEMKRPVILESKLIAASSVSIDG